MSEFVEFRIQPAAEIEENSEILTALLSEYSFDVFEVRDGCLYCFGKTKDFSAEDWAEIEELVQPFSEGKGEVRQLEKENWNALWETHYFEPVTVKNRLRLRAVFQEHDPSIPMELVIQPKMSFGTGHHSTTQLMMGLMLDKEEIFAGAEVLDMGAGTGILAILAEKLGAVKNTAIDIEDWAAANIVENAKLNNCSTIEALHGEASTLASLGRHYQIILANIHTSVLLGDAKAYWEYLLPGGYIFLSGFYEPEAKTIAGAYEALGAQLVAQESHNNWCALLLQKP
jgi:ribosomal protein L11 methyltransferase